MDTAIIEKLTAFLNAQPKIILALLYEASSKNLYLSF